MAIKFLNFELKNLVSSGVWRDAYDNAKIYKETNVFHDKTIIRRSFLFGQKVLFIIWGYIYSLKIWGFDKVDCT